MCGRRQGYLRDRGRLQIVVHLQMRTATPELRMQRSVFRSPQLAI